MKSRLVSFPGLALLLAFAFLSSSCSTQKNCPVCGTTVAGQFGIIDVAPVPEHNPTGEPGGPFNSFDISNVDSIHHRFYVSDRIGLDIPIFDTISNIALTAIGGDNSVAAGFTPSPCFTTIPATITGLGHLTRYGCRTAPTFTGIGGFGASGDFGGFPGAQCCASRANGVNPMSGPDGQVLTPDGTILFAGNGSSAVVVFDLNPVLMGTGPATVIANIPTGSSADYDSGLTNNAGIAPCIASWNGAAGSDPTCGDDRADEMSIGTVGGRTFVLVDNADPGVPFITIIDVTQVIATRSPANCLPPNPALAYNNTTTPPNMPQCIVGQIYYDGLPTAFPWNSPSTGANALTTAAPCPDTSVFINNNHATPEPSGAMNPAICFHGPIAPAGLGGSAFNPITGHFLLTNPNDQGDPHFGSVDEIDPLGFATGRPIVNSIEIPDCMPTSVVQGPGNNFLVGCGDHDGMAFPPNMFVINGSNLGAANAAAVAAMTEPAKLTPGVAPFVATFDQVGGVDEIWFNRGDNRYYLAARDMPNGPQLGVIDALTNTWLVNVPTNSNSHSVSVDSGTNHVFVPMQSGGPCGTLSSNGCVAIFAQQ